MTTDIYPLVWRKKEEPTLLEKVRRFVSGCLISFAYDLSLDAFEDFCSDNGYSFCEDCNGRPW